MIRITKAAISFKRQYLYTGKDHAECMKKIFKITKEIVDENTKGYFFGFIDQNGKFYTRYSAGIIALQAGQIDKQPMKLRSYMIKMEGR